ncbi:MAG: Ni,Fe-hydrogenase III large subunit [Gammaproteobacteria bacterium HGW-Gammaproteobacteria-3]|nr:MAG: Ni,Fe-hydrogenase III large subunit [Gammaproteobacteria bacterium HGW-Gammaproteobacteria-3]
MGTDSTVKNLVEALRPLQSIGQSEVTRVQSVVDLLQLTIASAAWGDAARIAKSHGARWAGVWADEHVDSFTVSACLEYRERYLLLRASVSGQEPELPSHAPFYQAADRAERHVQDLFGIRFTGHPMGTQRWTRHQAWDEGTFPLRKSFPLQGFMRDTTPSDRDYPFLKASGASVYEIPVGPVHAGIIEPGHFRFQAVGETVLNLEERFGYVHKGIEKIAQGRGPEGLAKLAGRVSGDTTVGHTWAACLAMEAAAGVECPARATYIRGILAERERVINHLGDMGAMCNDVGFAFGHYQFGRLRELWLRENQALFGHRLLMDCVVPGGVKSGLTPEGANGIRRTVRDLRGEVSELITVIDANSSLEDRFLATGVLTVGQAQALGALGFVGRASGQGFDVRKAPAYRPYNELAVIVPVETQGDVASRFWLRYKELRIALRLLEQMLAQLPEGELQADWQTPRTDTEGFAAVEGWRGEILCFVRFAADNRIGRYFPRDPSQINWPAVEKIQTNNIVPDFPICNKSVNASYSGQDL